MGGAMLRQWLTAETFSDIYIVKPSRLDPSYASGSTVNWVSTPEHIPGEFQPDIIIIAVRPGDLTSVVPSYARYSECLFISLAAGRKIAQIEFMLSAKPSLLRAMPNIASEVGAGMTFLTANIHASVAQKDLGEKILQAVGAVAWLTDETLFDVATTLSGCGPGYFFSMVEAMAKAGTELGLPTDFSMMLARQTIIGSGALLASYPAMTATDLRKAIANPGTMTEAALKQLADKENGLSNLMLKAMQAAISRAQEMSQ